MRAPAWSVSVLTNCLHVHRYRDGSVAEWLACWTQAQIARVEIAAATLSGNSLRQTVHTHLASVHQAAKLVAALLRVAGVTAGLAESNGDLPPGLWLTSPAGWLPRTGISSGTLRSVIEYGLFLPFYRNWLLASLGINSITSICRGFVIQRRGVNPMCFLDPDPPTF